MIDVRKVTNDMVLTLASDAADKFGIRVRDIYDKGNNFEAVKARRYCYRVLASAGWSHAAIGKVFDRDRSTVTYHLERGAKETRRFDWKPIAHSTPDDLFRARMGMAMYQNVDVKPATRVMSWVYDQ